MMTKQGIVNRVKFSSLSLSLITGLTVSGFAVAQTQLPSQLVSNNSGAANMVEGNVNTLAVEDVQTQPVGVTSSMSPVQAPAAEASSGLSVGYGGVSLSSAPSTGVGGANTGNANTGGLQVQNVTVQASPEAKATNMSAINSEYARAEMLRQRRVRSEVENETRLLERLEEGRLNDERVRQGSIEGYYSSVAGSSSATATAIGNNPTAVAVSNNTVSSEIQTVPVAATGTSTEVYSSNSTEFLGMGSFALSPFAGYRWFDNNRANYYRAQNRITAGVNLEGKFNEYLSFEGAFTYGHDKFYQNNFGFGGFGGFNQATYDIMGATRSRDTFEVTGGLKASMKLSSKVTPFIAGSLGGMLSKYNIDNEYAKAQLNAAGLQRSTTQFIGNVGGGLDFSVARNFTLGGRFDYQASLAKDSYSNMDAIWGDQSNRYRLTGSLQLVF
jgi:hypothetical protein